MYSVAHFLTAADTGTMTHDHKCSGTTTLFAALKVNLAYSQIEWRMMSGERR